MKIELLKKYQIDVSLHETAVVHSFMHQTYPFNGWDSDGTRLQWK